MGLQRVFEPLRIRGLEVPNRIARTAYGTALGTRLGALGGDAWVAYHAARARGGVGLTILEALAVHPSTGGVAFSGPDTVDAYRVLMAEIRPHGMRVFQQLFHAGHTSPAPGGRPPWSVSGIPGVYGTVPEAMDKAQIDELVAAYATAAGRCREGGLDGVELHIGHGYLLHEFLSPFYNVRDDAYGGSLPNRTRIVQEALRAIRAAVGDELVVGIRVSGSEMPGGVSVEDVQAVIQALEAEGLIDYLTTSMGDHFRPASIVGAMDAPAGYELPAAVPLTSVASVPTIVAGRLRTLEEAEQVLADGVADMVSMVRAHIADPDIVQKTREGRAAEVRPCIACNQGCVGGLGRFPPRLSCAVNPAVGFEATLGDDAIVRVPEPRRVVVIGGGPGGLEAARVAALSGHDVTLVDASTRLGGALNAASRAPRFGILDDLVRWQTDAVRRTGVHVELGRRWSAEEVVAHGPDSVIVATGARPRRDGLQPARPFEPARGVDQPHVLTAADLLRSGVPDGAGTAVVLDTVGHFEAVAAAEFLVDRGLALTFVTSHANFGGPYVQSTRRDKTILEFLYRGEFLLLVGHHLVAIGPGTCEVRPLQGERSRHVPADVVVLVTQDEPNRDIFDQVRDVVGHVRLVGDAVAPRGLQVAIAEGHHAARSIAAAT